jgi:hypothetical protein
VEMILVGSGYTPLRNGCSGNRISSVVSTPVRTCCCVAKSPAAKLGKGAQRCKLQEIVMLSGFC